MTNWT